MDASEALDREVIVERAEELRLWLSGMPLSPEALEALGRELDGIIGNDPGGYINGHRPLAGMTIDDFVGELGTGGGGAVGRVRGLGPEGLAELRALVEPERQEPPPESDPPPAPQQSVSDDAVAPASEPATRPAPRRRRRPALPATTAAEPPAPAPESTAAEEAVGSEQEAEADVIAATAPEPLADEALTPEPEATAAETPAPELAPRRRGRPPGRPSANRSTSAPAPTPAPAPPPLAPEGEGVSAAEDMALQQLVRLWPSLHPHARRAIVLYAGTLLIEGPYTAE